MRIQVARVETPNRTYIKAIVDVEDDHLVIRDRRLQQLAHIDAPKQVVNAGEFRYGDVTVTNTPGCGCGGTRIIEKGT